MFNVDLSGLNRLIAKLEQRSLNYQVALDEAVKFAQTTILNRVKLGQLVDGGYRVSNNPYQGSRYSRRQFNTRRNNSTPLTTNTHTLSFTGGLYRNFVIDNRLAPNKKNKLFVRSLGFTNNPVPNKNITYSQLAQIQEDKTGVGFQLSPSQLVRVVAKFKQSAGL